MNEIDLIINQFILESGKLYTLPELYQQLEQKILSNTASIDEISEILSTDAALNAKILKIANSPLYGFRAEVTTLSRALNLIGLKEVKNLVLMDTITNQFSAEENCNNVKMETFWQRSVYLALIAKRLSKKMKHPEPDRLFISAIMSRIGQLVCCSTLPQEVKLVLRDHFNPQLSNNEFAIEQQHLGFTYNQVSAKLLAHWKVPDEIIHSLNYLHKPNESPEKNNPAQMLDLSILHVATIFSGILEVDDNYEATEGEDMLAVTTAQSYIDKIDPSVNQHLNLDKTMVEDILFEIEMDCLAILKIVFPKATMIF